MPSPRDGLLACHRQGPLMRIEIQFNALGKFDRNDYKQKILEIRDETLAPMFGGRIGFVRDLDDATDHPQNKGKPEFTATGYCYHLSAEGLKGRINAHLQLYYSDVFGLYDTEWLVFLANKDPKDNDEWVRVDFIDDTDEEENARKIYIIYESRKNPAKGTHAWFADELAEKIRADLPGYNARLSHLDEDGDTYYVLVELPKSPLMSSSKKMTDHLFNFMFNDEMTKLFADNDFRWDVKKKK